MLMSMRLLSAPLRRVNSASLLQGASNHWDTQIKSTRLHTQDALQNEFVRQTETAGNQISNASRNQQLTDLAEDIAQKMLGPDWKERQEERRSASINAKAAQQ